MATGNKPQFITLSLAAELTGIPEAELKSRLEEWERRRYHEYMTIEQAAKELECSTVWARIFLLTTQTHLKSRQFYVHLVRHKTVYNAQDVRYYANKRREVRDEFQDEEEQAA